MNKLPPKKAEHVWDALEIFGGAHPADREDFLYAVTTTGITEWRFQGKLGFGGKFWLSNGRWYVSCYSEDLTPERIELVKRINDLLEDLRTD